MTEAAHLDRLLDAIELLEDERRAEARAIFRELIHENKDFEEAWLWMSVAVETIDESVVCLENVLRINPGNLAAASALYRLREEDIVSEARRARLRAWRDLSLVGFWLLVGLILAAMLVTMSVGFMQV